MWVAVNLNSEMRIKNDDCFSLINTHHVTQDFFNIQPSTSTNFLNSFKIKPHPDSIKPLKYLKGIYSHMNLLKPTFMSTFTTPLPTPYPKQTPQNPQKLVTGIADLLQIYISSCIDSMVTFHVEIINTTSIAITNLLLTIVLSDNLELISPQSNKSFYASITTKQIIRKTIVAKLKRFDDCSWTVIATLQDCVANPKADPESQYPLDIKAESGNSNHEWLSGSW